MRPSIPSVRLFSAQVFGQLIPVSRYRLIEFKRRLPLNAFHRRMTDALRRHVLRLANIRLTNHGRKVDATIHPAGVYTRFTWVVVSRKGDRT